MMTGKMKLLITESENFSENAILELKKYFEVEVANLFSEEELIEKIKTVMEEFPDARWYKLEADNASGIGSVMTLSMELVSPHGQNVLFERPNVHRAR